MATYSNVRDYFSGKVGSLVYSSWKGTKYVKVYVPPSNPNTAGQQGVRSTFGTLAHIGKSLHQTILKPYTFPKPQKETAYNVFIHINKEMFEHGSFDHTKLKIFDGSLPSVGIDNASYDETRKELETNWDTTAVTPAKGTDTAVVVAVQNGQVLGYEITARSAGNSMIDMSGTDLQVGKLYVYLAFIQPPTQNTHEPGIVSATHHYEIDVTVVRSADTKVDKKTEKKE
jgi:hypothetical protein